MAQNTIVGEGRQVARTVFTETPSNIRTAPFLPFARFANEILRRDDKALAIVPRRRDK